MSNDWQGDYDEEGNFSPNKNRRMREWREKRKNEEAQRKKDSIDRYYDHINGRLPKIKYGDGRFLKFNESADSKNNSEPRPSRKPKEEPPQPGLFD